MSRNPLGYDEHFQQEVRKARRLFFLLLPVAFVAIAGLWAVGEGVLSEDQIASVAGNAFSSVIGFFGGGN